MGLSDCFEQVLSFVFGHATPNFYVLLNGADQRISRIQKKDEYGKGPFRAERLDDGWRTVLRKSIANRISPAIPFRLAILLCKAKLNRSASAPGLTERMGSFLGAGRSGFRERRS